MRCGSLDMHSKASSASKGPGTQLLPPSNNGTVSTQSMQFPDDIIGQPDTSLDYKHERCLCGAQCGRRAALSLCQSCTVMGMKDHLYVPHVPTQRQRTCLHIVSTCNGCIQRLPQPRQHCQEVIWCCIVHLTESFPPTSQDVVLASHTTAAAAAVVATDQRKCIRPSPRNFMCMGQIKHSLQTEKVE